MQDIINKLNDKTKASFEKIIGTLNKNVLSSETEGEYYKCPMPVLSPGGCTVTYGRGDYTLAAPSTVSFELVKVLPCIPIYRIAFNVEDAAKAAEDAAYFNTVFVPVLNEAILRYKQSFGGEEVIRYGDYFLKFSDYMDLNGEYLEIRLVGKWASNKVVEEKTDVGS